MRFDRDGAQWFGAGWHGPEATGDDGSSGRDGGSGGGGWFRWTNEPAAHVNVLVSRRQAIHIRLDASAATTPDRSNAMKVMWNGEELQPFAPSLSPDEWTIPEAKVRRGLNVFTIQAEHVVIPGKVYPGRDPRPLGVAVRALSFEPAARQAGP